MLGAWMRWLKLFQCSSHASARFCVSVYIDRVASDVLSKWFSSFFFHRCNFLLLYGYVFSRFSANAIIRFMFRHSVSWNCSKETRSCSLRFVNVWHSDPHKALLWLLPYRLLVRMLFVNLQFHKTADKFQLCSHITVISVAFTAWLIIS
jgi:hypothetical protein